MNKKNEIEVYSKTNISIINAEIEDYDDFVFPKVIRRKELNLIKSDLDAAKPKIILDYGCGGGWLSYLLSRWGFNVIGIDVTENLLRKAKSISPKIEFILSDAERLPFRDEIFEYVIGISILHHINLSRGCSEIKRVSVNKSKFLFMEPNLLNPFSAFGRKFFSMETHTKGEKGFTPRYFKAMLTLSNFTIEKCYILFFLSFPIARFLKKTKIKPHSTLIKIISIFEEFMEKMPIIKHINSTIITIGNINRASNFS